MILILKEYFKILCKIYYKILNHFTAINEFSYKIDFVSFPLTRLDIKHVRYNKFIIIILSYYNINM